MADPVHCVTCSDEGVPMTVRVVRGDTVVCDGGVEVLADLIGPVEPATRCSSTRAWRS